MLCQGECDDDADCGSGLYCFQQQGKGSVPGCAGTANKDWDYCIKKEDAVLDSSPGYKGKTSPGSHGLGLCQGDCDKDSDCSAGLFCFQRTGKTPVPGCEGSGLTNYDYCVDNSYAPKPPGLPPALPPALPPSPPPPLTCTVTTYNSHGSAIFRKHYTRSTLDIFPDNGHYENDSYYVHASAGCLYVTVGDADWCGSHNSACSGCTNEGYSDNRRVDGGGDSLTLPYDLQGDVCGLFVHVK